jgi:hypothetical protein
MILRPLLIGLLLPCIGALVLLVPAIGLADEPPATTTTGATTTETTPAPEATTPAPAPETPPAPAAPSTSETAPTPAPAVPSVTETATTPQVSAQRPQGATPGVVRAHAKSNGSPTAGRSGTTGGSSVAPKRGKRAPKPSALTPPLPLSLSSSIAGVPGFFIESFRIPPFLLPIYQAAGTAYGVPWQVLAAINEVETDYGRDLSVSSANAEGWMQFLPSSWATYGVDANGDGFKDPYNPADAIFAAARYLRAAGAATDIRGAVFSYNHSQAYVESVMLRAKLLGGTPTELLGAITGLTEARFPVHAQSHFSDGFANAPAGSPGAPKAIAGTTIYATPGAPVIAVQDGQIVQIGDSAELGSFISLRDAYGNTYTYARLGDVATLYPVLKPHGGSAPDTGTSRSDESPEPRPSGPASAGTQAGASAPAAEGAGVSALSLGTSDGLGSAPAPSSPANGSSTATAAPAATAPSSIEPDAALPEPAAATPESAPAPTEPAATATPTTTTPATTTPTATTPAGTPSSSAPQVFRDGPNDVYLHPLHSGARVIAGTVLGHLEAGSSSGEADGPHMLFQIRPAGVGAPLIDPKPILDGWVQLENSSIFRAKGQNPFLGSAPSVGQVLLESKEQLEQQVLENTGITIYPCGRQDIETGQIDRRVLATLEFLEVSGLKPTVSALKCGHSELTTEGNVSEHSTGDAVDISEVNGIPIVGHQGPGTITDTTIRKLLTLQGTMKPHQIISLMTYPGADNTLAMADHYNHIHVGFRPLAESAGLGASLSSSITPSEWIKLIDRLGEIPDPAVANGPSAAAIPVTPSASGK